MRDLQKDPLETKFIMKKINLVLIITCFLNVHIFCQSNKSKDLPINWHHLSYDLNSIPGISTNRLYNELLQEKTSTKIIVAVLDAGVDIMHEDLKENIWINKDEIPNNGIDDDKNGYIDDVHGWNFLGNKNGENLHYDTWEITRKYQKLRDRYSIIDTTDLTELQKKDFYEFKKLEADIFNQRSEAKKMYDRLTAFREELYKNIEIISPYSKNEELTIELLKSIDTKNDTTAEKARVRLIKSYEAGYNKQFTDLVYNSYKNKYQYKLNPDFDNRYIIGDKTEDLNEKYYGNPDVAGPDPFHGTSVAGIIGAIRDNKMGIDGIANNVLIMPVRVIPSGDERDKDVANAIYYAVDNGAKILNMSFGKPISPYREHVEKAIKYAEEKCVLLITGSGNDGENVDSFPRYPNKYYSDGTECETWINVGATSWKLDSEFVCSFSNYGRNNTDLMAPGNNITTLYPENKTLLSEGTSIAAPMVSGVAALVWSHFPELTAQQIKKILLESIDYYGNMRVNQPSSENKNMLFKNLSKTGGVINAYKAFLLATEESK